MELDGATLYAKSQRDGGTRKCSLSVTAAHHGQVHSFSVIGSSDGSKRFVVRGKDLKAGASEVLFDSLRAGSSGTSQRAEGQFTWHDGVTNQVVTSIFHASADARRCRFQGTATGAG